MTRHLPGVGQDTVRGPERVRPPYYVQRLTRYQTVTRGERTVKDLVMVV